MRGSNETLEQHVGRLTQAAIRRWQSALAASEDARSQAIGLALSNAQPGPHMPTAEELVPGNEPSKDTPTNNKLVLLATESRDPAIYSLAIGQCRDATNDMAAGPCQGLSWEDWASIDPDNGMPWLWIAAKAEHAGDQQGVEEALDKASAASRIEAYGGALSVLALGALPRDSSALEKTVAWTDVVAMLPAGPPLAILSLCSEAAIQQAPRKQQCAAIATTLAKQGSTVISQALASSLADRLGFPEDERAALKSERKTLRAALSKSYPSNAGAEGARFGCQTVLGLDGFVDMLRTAGGNERAALLAVAVSGR
jgi:hypothetical protein